MSSHIKQIKLKWKDNVTSEENQTVEAQNVNFIVHQAFKWYNCHVDQVNKANDLITII